MKQELSGPTEAHGPFIMNMYCSFVKLVFISRRAEGVGCFLEKQIWGVGSVVVENKKLRMLK